MADASLSRPRWYSVAFDGPVLRPGRARGASGPLLLRPSLWSRAAGVGAAGCGSPLPHLPRHVFRMLRRREDPGCPGGQRCIAGHPWGLSAAGPGRRLLSLWLNLFGARVPRTYSGPLVFWTAVPRGCPCGAHLVAGPGRGFPRRH
ncbi:hypothetical protein NDU88_002026 [Pleurodeles waltl]|uniref:Uncharacterized protein n=1 Tax=Pleurodeles waltl TaxID=8319 RepID=A0AAV7W0Q2_PLEWA|nr:hypothetical protein NDU88_002026 [Pleurodeles waltl]